MAADLHRIQRHGKIASQPTAWTISRDAIESGTVGQYDKDQKLLSGDRAAGPLPYARLPVHSIPSSWMTHPSPGSITRTSKSGWTLSPTRWKTVKTVVEVKWENPKTGHNGTLTPLNKKTHDGMDCRDVDIRNFAGNFTGRAIHLMCRKDGKWLAITN